MLKGWLKEFLLKISEVRPHFVALHCQEVGGKNYECSMQYVGGFVQSILDGVSDLGFARSLVILDEDYSTAENFTALGNIYLIHEDVGECSAWNFNEGKFEVWHGNKTFSGCIEGSPLLEKAKFPQEFFPECKWSRKGFLRTRWKLDGTVFDLVNIHLFHDASNFIASQSVRS
jgi:inositol-1,4,5-trisphosphate 5-phosphatase